MANGAFVETSTEAARAHLMDEPEGIQCVDDGADKKDDIDFLNIQYEQ